MILTTIKTNMDQVSIMTINLTTAEVATTTMAKDNNRIGTITSAVVTVTITMMAVTKEAISSTIRTSKITKTTMVCHQCLCSTKTQ